MAHLGHGRLQMRHTLGRPFEEAHRIPFGVQQAFSIRQQGHILFDDRLSAASCLALSCSWSVLIPSLQFADAASDRILGDMGLAVPLERRILVPGPPRPDSAATASHSAGRAGGHILLLDSQVSCPS